LWPECGPAAGPLAPPAAAASGWPGVAGSPWPQLESACRSCGSAGDALAVARARWGEPRVAQIEAHRRAAGGGCFKRNLPLPFPRRVLLSLSLSPSLSSGLSRAWPSWDRSTPLYPRHAWRGCASAWPLPWWDGAPSLQWPLDVAEAGGSLYGCPLVMVGEVDLSSTVLPRGRRPACCGAGMNVERPLSRQPPGPPCHSNGLADQRAACGGSGSARPFAARKPVCRWRSPRP